MVTLHTHRLGLLIVLALCLTPLLVTPSAPARDRIKTEDYKGKVVPLAGVLEKLGARLDPDAAPSSLALVGEDGQIYPLVKDDGSRMFFKDRRLLDRPMLLTGRVLPDVHMLQVVQVHSYVKGKLCDVYYWCDVCSIRTSEDGKCACCGGPVTLREEPVEK